MKFRLKELMARKEIETGEKVTYYSVSKATGISTSTLSNLANNKQKMVGLSVLDRLCAYFQCPIQDLMIYIPEGGNGDGRGKLN